MVSCQKAFTALCVGSFSEALAEFLRASRLILPADEDNTVHHPNAKSTPCLISFSICTGTDHDSVAILALPLVTLTPSCFARETISIRFLDETACAISAAYVLLCMRRSSRSRVLFTRNDLCPEGIMWRVFLLLPKPIFGMTAVPLNRLLTRLSMPFGFLQLGSTHLNRSDWWRLKGVVFFFTIGTCFFAATILTECGADKAMSLV